MISKMHLLDNMPQAERNSIVLTIENGRETKYAKIITKKEIDGNERLKIYLEASEYCERNNLRLTEARCYKDNITDPHILRSTSRQLTTS